MYLEVENDLHTQVLYVQFLDIGRYSTLATTYVHEGCTYFHTTPQSRDSERLFRQGLEIALAREFHIDARLTVALCSGCAIVRRRVLTACAQGCQ